MNEQIMQSILQKIKDYQSIMIFRHIRMDGDCMGATKGFKDILTASFPKKDIYLIDPSQSSEFLAFLGGDDEEVSDEIYAKSLAIVLDTASLDRISNKKYALCKEIIKIDHHINITPYGDISWVEEERSSTCEMITHFYQTFKDELKITKEGAKYLFTGMVTDSGRFRYREVSGETMRLAASLLDIGIDTDTLYAHLYMQSKESMIYKGYILKNMKVTENGVAYFFVSNKTQAKLGLSREDASAGVSALENIENCLIWIAFIENEDKSIRVRLRSRFITVNDIAEKYHGGGHSCASGATVYSKKELKSLINDADAKLKEYKENNEGWL